MSAHIPIWIDPLYGDQSNVIYEAIKQVMEIAGWQTTLTSQKQKALFKYAPTKQLPFGEASTIKAWQEIRQAKPANLQGLIIPDLALSQDLKSFDPILTCYFFLNGIHEKNGQIPVDEYVKIWGLLNQPIVQLVIASLSKELQKLPKMPVPKPFWPKGKTWTFCLTHDCDRPSLYRPIGYFLDALRAIHKFKILSFIRLLAQSLYSIIFFFIKKDPYGISIQQWLEFEKENNIAATYFIGVKSRFETGSHANDLPYNWRSKEVVKLASDIAKSGQGLALHSSIEVWGQKNGFDKERTRFIEGYSNNPQGLRAHYWSMGRGSPEAALELAVKSGYSYDSSMGMSNYNGYRRGTCYPFNPIDPNSEERVTIIEIPPIIMDGSLHSNKQNPTQAMQEVNTRIKEVKEAKGCITLDWHTDTLKNSRYSATTRALLLEIEQIINDPTCWVADCDQIAEWIGKDRWK